MSASDLLWADKSHLAQLLEAIQRCAYFLDGVNGRLDWPLTGDFLDAHKKDEDLFGALAAFNEHFAKLQDTLAAGMRHAHLLQGERADSFLKVLAYYEKLGVIESLEDWQTLRAARNLSAHDYEIDYPAVAEHFNMLNTLLPSLMRVACAFVPLCADRLGISPASQDFSPEFQAIARRYS